ncbi:unnamed protein product [Cyclocybe aegerita]|uniref:Uncharacterized protein n=1 Tax=Cyclocybe aegerita TaxID=1973307 RepID=A0A8S0VRQ5_CYCAE|nr:unnamed protein product [Cyclocybe aegerita]
MASSSLVGSLSPIISPTFAARVKAQLVSPASSQIVKPHELPSALARPLQVAHYEPHREPEYLAATIAYGIILDGNKRIGGARFFASLRAVQFALIFFYPRVAFFLANEYVRAMGLPGLSPKLSDTDVREFAERQCMA